MKLRAGFTMIELMMVLVILAILAAVAVPVYNSLVNRSKAAELTTACGVIKNAADVWRAQQGHTDASVPDYSDLTSEMLIGQADFTDMQNVDGAALDDNTVTITYDNGVEVELSGAAITGDLSSQISTFKLESDGSTTITEPS